MTFSWAMFIPILDHMWPTGYHWTTLKSFSSISLRATGVFLECGAGSSFALVITVGVPFLKLCLCMHVYLSQPDVEGHPWVPCLGLYTLGYLSSYTFQDLPVYSSHLSSGVPGLQICPTVFGFKWVLGI